MKALVGTFNQEKTLLWIVWKLSRNIFDSSSCGARPQHIFLILRFHHRSNNTKWWPLVTYPLQSSAFSLIRQFTYKDCTAVQIPNSPICKKRNTPPPRLACLLCSLHSFLQTRPLQHRYPIFVFLLLPGYLNPYCTLIFHHLRQEFPIFSDKNWCSWTFVGFIPIFINLNSWPVWTLAISDRHIC